MPAPYMLIYATFSQFILSPPDETESLRVLGTNIRRLAVSVTSKYTFKDSKLHVHYHVSCLYLPSFSIATKKPSASL